MTATVKHLCEAYFEIDLRVLQKAWAPLTLLTVSVRQCPNIKKKGAHREKRRFDSPAGSSLENVDYWMKLLLYLSVWHTQMLSRYNYKTAKHYVTSRQFLLTASYTATHKHTHSCLVALSASEVLEACFCVLALMCVWWRVLHLTEAVSISVRGHMMLDRVDVTCLQQFYPERTTTVFRQSRLTASIAQHSMHDCELCAGINENIVVVVKIKRKLTLAWS